MHACMVLYPSRYQRRLRSPPLSPQFGSQDQTQVVRLSAKYLYPVSHLAGLGLVMCGQCLAVHVTHGEKRIN